MRAAKKISDITFDRENVTYADYCNLIGNKHYEVYGGVLSPPLPGKEAAHQKTLGILITLLVIFLENRPEIIAYSPRDVVCLEAGQTPEQARNIYQPELMVLVDTSKNTDQCIIGAPEFVVEIKNPVAAEVHRAEKFKAYLRYGVQEYWSVNPQTKSIQQFLFEEHQVVQEREYISGQRIFSSAVQGFAFQVERIFGEE